MSAINKTSALAQSQKLQVCDLCHKHDPTVKDYAENFELQTAVGDYLERISGESVNVADIARLCDDCCEKINLAEDRPEEENGKFENM